MHWIKNIRLDVMNVDQNLVIIVLNDIFSVVQLRNKKFERTILLKFA